MHTKGRRVTVKAGDSCLVDIPSWDFHWQQAYLFSTPVPITVGTQPFGPPASLRRRAHQTRQAPARAIGFPAGQLNASRNSGWFDITWFTRYSCSEWGLVRTITRANSGRMAWHQEKAFPAKKRWRAVNSRPGPPSGRWSARR